MDKGRKERALSVVAFFFGSLMSEGILGWAIEMRAAWRADLRGEA